MKNDKIQTQISVNNYTINVLRIADKEYISLTDLARYADAEEPRLPIRDWMRNKEIISYLGLWESINNINFKGSEFATFKNEAYQNKIDWRANRVLAKDSYVVHTDAIKNLIVPSLTEEKKKYIYAEEITYI